jgi:DNA-binding PadR family transcriptional regulator
MADAKSTRKAVAQTASLDDARAAAGAPLAPEAGGPGTADPLVGELRRAGLLPLLVLHSLAREASYGNQLMDRIRDLTGGLVVVNPNTMYPLLRSLEARALIEGKWEHPERRSRRFYELTPAGEAELGRLAEALLPRLEKVVASVEMIRGELAQRLRGGVRR